MIKKCVPQKEVTIRLNDKVWFNSELRREIRKRDSLRKLARRSNSDFNINKYKKQRNHVTNLKKHAKEQFYFNVNTLLDDFSISNSKSYWSLIKQLVKSAGDISPISQLKKENNDLISDDYVKACLLNNYFCFISTLNDSNTSKRDFPLRLILLSAVGKVFERIVFKEVFNHLTSNNLLHKFHSRSVYQLIEVYYRIYICLWMIIVLLPSFYVIFLKHLIGSGIRVFC